MESFFVLTENPNYAIGVTGNLKNLKTGKLLKKRVSKHGYTKYRFYINGKPKEVSAHRLVAKYFLSTPNDGEIDNLVVNHIDGDKSNNNADNLEWTTHSENIKHAYRIGLCFISEEQKESLSKRAKIGRYASKKVINQNTGDIYNSIKEASEVLGVKMKTLSAQINGQLKNKFNLKHI